MMSYRLRNSLVSWVCLLTVILTSTLYSNAFASEATKAETWEKTERSGNKIYWVLYPTEERWYAQKFVKRSGNIQDRVESRVFESEKKAKDFLNPIVRSSFRKIDPSQKSLSDEQSVVFPEVNRFLWQVTNQWNADWERRYGEWVSSELNTNFFQTYRIETDCADAAFAVRWIFSRINGLPAGSHLAGSGDLITQATVRPEWRNLRTAAEWYNDELFRAALDYVLDNTYTHTLQDDTYPIQIARESLLPGTIFLSIWGSSGHTRQFRRVESPTRITITNSTVPRAIRSLSESSYYQSEIPQQGAGGLLKHRWIVPSGSSWRMLSASSMPDYSLEQFDPNFSSGYSNYHQAVLHRLFGDLMDVDLNEMRRSIPLIQQMIEERIPVVNEGFRICQTEDCSEGTDNWENWGTPSRDARLKQISLNTINLARESSDNRVAALWNSEGNRIRFDIAGYDLSLQQIAGRFAQSQYSFDPRVAILQRWGVATTNGLVIETAHPYSDNENQEWNFVVPNGQQVRLYFGLFDLENGYDYMRIYDHSNNMISQYTGSLGSVTTEWLRPGAHRITFTTDGSVVQQGFRLDRVETR